MLCTASAVTTCNEDKNNNGLTHVYDGAQWSSPASAPGAAAGWWASDTPCLQPHHSLQSQLTERKTTKTDIGQNKKEIERDLKST